MYIVRRSYCDLSRVGTQYCGRFRLNTSSGSIGTRKLGPPAFPFNRSITFSGCPFTE